MGVVTGGAKSDKKKQRPYVIFQHVFNCDDDDDDDEEDEDRDAPRNPSRAPNVVGRGGGSRDSAEAWGGKSGKGGKGGKGSKKCKSGKFSSSSEEEEEEEEEESGGESAGTEVS